MKFGVKKLMCKEEFDIYHNDPDFKKHIHESLFQQVFQLFFDKYSSEFQCHSKRVSDRMIEVNLVGYDYINLYRQEKERRELVEEQLHKLTKGL